MKQLVLATSFIGLSLLGSIQTSQAKPILGQQVNEREDYDAPLTFRDSDGRLHREGRVYEPGDYIPFSIDDENLSESNNPAPESNGELEKVEPPSRPNFSRHDEDLCYGNRGSVSDVFDHRYDASYGCR